MSEISNPPAFPTPSGHATIEGRTVEVCTTGMTLRDWFAGQAIVGKVGTINEEVTAQDAYKLADAMLRERLK